MVKKRSLSKDVVLKLIRNDSIYPGGPPEAKMNKCKGKYWSNGIKFLYWDRKLTKVFSGWYFCEICKEYLKYKKKLSDGTTSMKNHSESHKQEMVYTLKESELKLFAENATTFGATHGGINEDQFFFPTPKNWFVACSFISQLRCY